MSRSNERTVENLLGAHGRQFDNVDPICGLELAALARATALRIIVVVPFTWLYYKNIYNPIKLFWHKCLSETLKEFIRRRLGWRTWADHDREQQALLKLYQELGCD